MAPEVAIEPDPAGDDGQSSAMAVWLEQVDENPFDLIPAVTHVYARYSTSGLWKTNNASCPSDGRSENIDSDGVCQVDGLTNSYNATAPRIAMNGDGDAIVVWQQSDGTDCFSAVSGTQPCTRIYARAFTAGTWSSTVSLVSKGGVNTPAANPDIAMEPDGGGTAIVVFDQWFGTYWGVSVNRCGAGGSGGVCGAGADEWGAAGTADISVGGYVAGSPRIGMDAAGEATVGWIRHFNVNNGCMNPLTGALFTCRASRVFVTRSNTDASAWGAGLEWTTTNISPGVISACGDGTGTCINFGQLRVARGATTGFVIFKAYEDGDPAVDGSSCCGFGTNDPDQNADSRSASIIYSNRVTNATTANTALDYYRVNDGASNGTITCTSLTDASSQGVERVLNCDLDAPDIAVEPDSGSTAMAVFEQYNGTNSFIRSKRYSGGWQTSAVISSGSNDAYAPRVSTDNSGNTVAVWVQNDGSKWRIYSNCYAVVASACGGGATVNSWQGSGIIDGNLGVESAYFNPVVAMDQLGSAMSLFIGWTSIGSFTSTRLLSVTGP